MAGVAVAGEALAVDQEAAVEASVASAEAEAVVAEPEAHGSELQIRHVWEIRDFGGVVK